VSRQPGRQSVSAAGHALASQLMSIPTAMARKLLLTTMSALAQEGTLKHRQLMRPPQLPD
jgi:hypothetical protein